MRKSFEWLTQDSRKFLANGYIPKEQTAEERIRIISIEAMCILKESGINLKTHDKFKDFSDKFYNYMSRGWFSLSSPVWSNFGTTKGLPISCFGSYVGDSVEDIMTTTSEVGMMSKYGGGTSAYFGGLRPRGTEIKGNGISNGSFSFLKLFDSTIDVISQGSTRRGQFAGYQDIEHDDIEEWLDIQIEGNPIQLMYYGVVVGRDWLEQMKAGDKNKRKIWAKILQNRTEIGVPYLLFRDNVNENKPDVYKDKNLKIHSSNLCVSPNTQILTDDGYKSIGDLEGESVNVWNGENWSNVDIFKTGVNQELVRVKTSSGYELDCTPYHKFYVQQGYSNSKVIEVRAKDLKNGDKLIKFDLPLIKGYKTLEYSYINGFYSGDGCLTKQGQRIYLYHEKRNLIDRFDIIEKWYNQPNYLRIYGHTDKLKDKFFVPDSSYTIESRLDWLAGYLDADGTVLDNNGSQSLQIPSVEKEFLKEIQLMLQTLGCDSKVTLNRLDGIYDLPKNDGTGDLGKYSCKELNRLIINGNSLYKLSQLGLTCSRLKWDIKKPNRECSQFIKIESIEYLKDKSDTFCFTEPIRGMGMFNGILTGQCSEISLPSNEEESFVCCLSSMNLLHYDEWKNTDAVEVLTYFLDAVMTEFIRKTTHLKFMEKANLFAKKHRALGLGVLGWHSLLQSKMIPFDSFDAMQLNAEVFKLIQEKSLKASKELAELYGEPEVLKGYGRRNTTLTAIAPTKSSSFILGQVSQGVEPIKSNYYVKDLAKLKSTYKNTNLIELLKTKGKDIDEVWDSILLKDGSVQHLDFLTEYEKNVFKTFSEISQLSVIQQTAQRQKYICQSQSINLMVHPNTTTKDINKLYLLAEELGVKSLYYQHSVNAAQELNRDLLTCSTCES
jgi:ribonucleoside-diphosphate reductase alpha chain